MTERFKELRQALGHVLLSHNVRLINTPDGVAVQDIDCNADRDGQYQRSLGLFDDQLTITADTRKNERMLKWFDWTHLPNSLQLVSARFADLAERIVSDLDRDSERTVALRKLLEAKDAAVRRYAEQYYEVREDD